VIQFTPPGSGCSIQFRAKITAATPNHDSYSSFATFSDPDGNGWLLQEVTTRLPGRVDPAATSFASASDLAAESKTALYGRFLMESGYAMVLTTTATEAQATALARSIVEAGLGACVQIEAIRSVYRWQGEVRDEPEWRLAIKTTAQRYADLERHIRGNHSYETPEIVWVEIAGGSEEYLRWIEECVG